MKNIDFLMLNNHQKFFCLFSDAKLSRFYIATNRFYLYRNSFNQYRLIIIRIIRVYIYERKLKAMLSFLNKDRARGVFQKY